MVKSKRITDFRDSPKLGDGNISALLLADYLLYFRDNPKLGDGNRQQLFDTFKVNHFISEITPIWGRKLASFNRKPSHLVNFRYNPKLGDGNVLYITIFSYSLTILEIAPNKGTEIYFSRYTLLKHFNFRDSPKLGDGKP